MFTFNQKQIEEIIRLLQDSHWYFVATQVGPSYVPSDVMKRLHKLGFTEQQILKYPDLAFKFGYLSHYLSDPEINKLNFVKLKQLIKSKKYLPFSEAEKFAFSVAEQKAINGIKGLGNKYSQNVHNIIIEGDSQLRAKYEKIITDAAKKTTTKRLTQRQFIQEIADMTGDWSRDLDRMTDFILHESYDGGRAQAILKDKGNDAKVYKRVHPDACKYCKKVYLKNGRTKEPKIFTITELLENGSNIGRKADDYVAVVGPTHPWCRCDLIYLQSGQVWSVKKNKFVQGKLSKRAQEIKEKIKITTSTS